MSESAVHKTEQLVQPILDEMNLELVDVTFGKEGKNWYLRVYIDTEKGVGLDECQDVSEKLSKQLDEGNVISQAYFLEVSSPGAERPLKKDKDFRNAFGKQIRVTTYAPVHGEKTFEGQLIHFDGDRLQLSVQEKTEQKEVEIPYEKVASARLAVTFQ